MKFGAAVAEEMRNLRHINHRHPHDKGKSTCKVESDLTSLLMFRNEVQCTTQHPVKRRKILGLIRPVYTNYWFRRP